MSSALFSPLSKGYGSWEDGDLEAHDETVLPKPILPNLLEGEDASFKDKTLNIPLRTKTAQSIITELYKTKITAPPPEETYTVYSRPRTAATPRSTFSYSTPRTAQSVRTKSAAPSLITQSEHTTRSDGEIVLPKTFLTRRGALLLFSAPDELKFSKEQKCYLSGQQIGPPIRILDDGVPLRTVNKLTSSVLQYGRDWGPGSDLESYSSHYDKTFLKFLKNVDDEEAMDLHAQPGGDMSFYLRDLQFRTRSSMGFRPTSGRSVTSELQRAELTEELRKIDTTDERNAYRISADVSRLMEPYSLQSSRSSIAMDMRTARQAGAPKTGRLSASRLAASLKSTKYLGRNLTTPQQPMSISPWGLTESPIGPDDLPLTAPSPGTRPCTTKDGSRPLSVRSKESVVSVADERSEGESGSAILRQGEEEYDEEILAAMQGDVESSVHILGRAQSITGADIGAIELEDGEPITGRYSGGDDYIVDTTQNIVDGSESGSTWIQPDMLEGVQEQESERTVEERDDDVHSASAPLSLPEDEDQWKGNQVDEERPKSTLSLGDSEKIHTTPVTSEKEMAEAPSGAESEKIKSAVESQGGSRRGSKGMWSVASSRPGSVQSGSRPGSGKAASRLGSVHAESQHGSVKTDSRPSSVKSEIRPSSVKSESRRSSVRAISVSGSGTGLSHQSSVKKLSELSSERPDNGSQPVSVAGEADVEGLEKIEIIMQPREASHITEDFTKPDSPAEDADQIVVEPSKDVTDTQQDDTTEPTKIEPTSPADFTPPVSRAHLEGTSSETITQVEAPLIDEKSSARQSVQSPLASKPSTPLSKQSSPTHKQGVPKDIMIIPKSPTPPALPKEAKKPATPTSVVSANQKLNQETSVTTPVKKVANVDTKQPVTTTAVPSPPKSAAQSKEEIKPKGMVEQPPPQEKKESALDLDALRAMVTKKTESRDKTKVKKVGPPKKEKRKKATKMQFVDSIGIEGYEEPSNEEFEQMVQQELAKHMAEKNLIESAPKKSDKETTEKPEHSEEGAVPATDADVKPGVLSESIMDKPAVEKPVPEVTSEDEDAAIEAQIKAKFADKPKNKKNKKQIAMEKAALKEANRVARMKREEEKKELEEKKRQKEEEKRRLEMMQKRNKQIAEEEAQDAARLAEEAREAEEEARQMLQAARKKAREERDAKRKADSERRKQEREAQREERKRMEEEARKREQEMLQRLASVEERKRLREEEEERQWELEEQQREEEEERMRQEEEEKKRMMEEEDKIRELERQTVDEATQAEEEAMARLIRERLEAEERKRLALEAAEKEREAEEMRRQEELRRQEAEAEKRRLRELEEQRRMEEERQRLLEIQRLEEEARQRVREELEKRRAILLRRRDYNREHMNHLTNVRKTQGLTRPWVFSYYVHWPRATYEKPLPSGDKKKKGFRARPKPKTP